MLKKIVFASCFTLLLSGSVVEASTAVLTPDVAMKKTVQEVYQQYQHLNSGKVADYIPELAKVQPDLFGIVIVTVDGHMISLGDVNVPFAIESVSKPFAYMLALHDNGEKIITDKVGLNATGFPFNSVMAIEVKPNHLQNPLVNAGAIEIASFIKGQNSADKWQRELAFFKQLSDGKPYLGEAVYQSETATYQHNQGITLLMQSYGLMNGNGAEALDALDRYTKQCSIMVTATQLAIMGATLANGGVHPLSHQRLIEAAYARDALSEMVVNGLYENSGAWWWTTGLPAKSGVGGGFVAVVPNKMAIVVFSPRLDEAGNSVRAQAVIKDLSSRWHLHLLQSH